jgi:hypothetical protein
MANTRFNYDSCRTIKQLQQSTDPGRWIMNVPGNGSNPSYIEDPQIIIQKWGANLRTNTINLESELLGINKMLSRDCLGKDNYTNFNVSNEAILYPSSRNLYTEQSRVIMPAWTARDLEQVDWYYPPLNPQENTCLPFENNLNTRILEKNCFERKRHCFSLSNNDSNIFPNLPINSIKNNYLCTHQNSCEKVNTK